LISVKWRQTASVATSRSHHCCPLDFNQSRIVRFVTFIFFLIPGAATVPIRDILLHLEARDSTQPTIEFASSLAVRIGAHLTAAGLAIDYPPPPVGPTIGGLGFGGAIALEKLKEENCHALEQAGQKFTSGAPTGLQTNFTVIQGYRGEACYAFARLARYFDLSIVSQAAPNQASIDQRVVTETLFGSGRPLFIVPFIHKGPARLDRAMICWDGGAQSARAIAAAMPLLALSHHVEIVTIGGDWEIPPEPDLKIAIHLARHGVKASLTVLPDAREVGEAILSYAADTSADYIVMGGYGHWRFTELVIGGTTKTILGSMTTPVLMTH
jgi:nucleotide-binding universal stress UspA family protein